MSEWQNGGLLRVIGLNGVSIRILIQDGGISVRSEGCRLSPEGMRKVAEALLEGAEALTQDGDSDTVK